ncbi:hypothetical protein Ae263Ps1_2599 [Pseudonocardia sp. Ae263_Ps1]|nr:hypothetical protein Ae150APs1_2726c [Pseudonocardia sp. Ae150A_Ps1]OLL85544.1 hypothetical protein Ae263Ps1_2599 [Pseudonocardia sp. Ae263_Ps1]OLL94428.1 hypothetical protein Ae356Ps1_4325c [Pseudonocardia sp. Ae356_Ps1]
MAAILLVTTPLRGFSSFLTALTDQSSTPPEPVAISLLRGRPASGFGRAASTV